MLQLMGFLLCAYLVFKGAEIWMIGASAPKEHGWAPAWMGALLFVAAVLVAGVFAWGFMVLGNSMPSIPGLR